MFLSIHLGNGYIEGHELDDLLQELASSLNANDTSSEVSGLFLSEILKFLLFFQFIPDGAFRELKACFLDAYDENADGRIEIGEVYFSRIS